MKIKTGVMALLIPAILFGSVLLTSALGLWHTETQRIPVKYADGEAAGEYNPADIRGSYDLGTVSTLFDIPLADLGIAFHVPKDADLATYQLKNLETLWGSVDTSPYEIGTGAVRLFVATYKGLPLEPEEDSGLPDAAVDLILENGMPTDEQRTFLEANRVHAVPSNTDVASALPDTEKEPDPPATTPAPEASASASASAALHDAAETDRKVTGNTTWKDLEDWGVSREDMETVFGQKIKYLATKVKDDCSAAGIPFSSIKEQLQTMVDSLE